MSKKFRDRQGSQSMAGYKLPEPVNVVAEAKAEYAEVMADYPQHAETAEAEMIMRLIDEVERLQAEVKSLNEYIQMIGDVG